MASDHESDTSQMSSAEESFLSSEADNNTFSWDYNNLSLIEVSGDLKINQSDYMEGLEEMLNDIKKEMGDIEADDCGLTRLYPESKQIVQNELVVDESEMQCETSESQNATHLYAICIDSLNNTREVQQSLYELSRQDIYLPETQIIVSEETRNNIVNSNPYRKSNPDFTSHRMNTILAFVWDSAVITTIQQNSKLE